VKYLEKIFCPYCGGHLERFIDHEGKQRLKCRRCRAIIYENPIPASALVIPSPDDPHRILLVKRAVEPCKGEYSLSGGFMEIDETAEECAIREMLEETGFHGRIKNLLGINSQPSPQYKMVLIFGYEMEIIGGKLAPSDDAQDAAFFPLDNHPKIAFETHQHFVDIYEREIQGSKIITD